ncbi:hypothetical protein T484DRAFT_1867115 [Baffinella frigidus]|nr:hypothetical protein T484DRAFT_1867115 [Cryptophyta sp. CCMP2293]
MADRCIYYASALLGLLGLKSVEQEDLAETVKFEFLKDTFAPPGIKVALFAFYKTKQAAKDAEDKFKELPNLNGFFDDMAFYCGIAAEVVWDPVYVVVSDTTQEGRDRA